MAGERRYTFDDKGVRRIVKAVRHVEGTYRNDRPRQSPFQRQARPWMYAEITAGDGPYSWEERAEDPDNPGEFVTPDGPRSGAHDGDYPAYGENGAAASVGDIVRLSIGANGDHYVFRPGYPGVTIADGSTTVAGVNTLTFDGPLVTDMTGGVAKVRAVGTVSGVDADDITQSIKARALNFSTGAVTWTSDELGNVTFVDHYATATESGLVSTGTQSFAGEKTFVNDVICQRDTYACRNTYGGTGAYRCEFMVGQPDFELLKAVMDDDGTHFGVVQGVSIGPSVSPTPNAFLVVQGHGAISPLLLLGDPSFHVVMATPDGGGGLNALKGRFWTDFGGPSFNVTVDDDGGAGTVCSLVVNAGGATVNGTALLDADDPISGGAIP